MTAFVKIEPALKSLVGNQKSAFSLESTLKREVSKMRFRIQEYTNIWILSNISIEVTAFSGVGFGIYSSPLKNGAREVKS